jgi:hypothetical protein
VWRNRDKIAKNRWAGCSPFYEAKHPLMPVGSGKTDKSIEGEICLIFAAGLNPALDRTEQVNKIRSSATSVYLLA